MRKFTTSFSIPRIIEKNLPRKGVEDLLFPRFSPFDRGLRDPVKSNRVMQAMLKWIKIDIEEIKRAYDGE